MTTSEPVVNSLLNRATEIRALLLSEEETIQAAEAKRDQLMKDLAALDHVAQMYTGTPSPTATTNPDPRGLADLTLGQGLFHIATQNEGILVVVDAKRELIACGKIKAKNAGPRIYSHIANDSRFQRVAPGRFQLVEKNGTRPSRMFEGTELT